MGQVTGSSHVSYVFAALSQLYAKMLWVCLLLWPCVLLRHLAQRGVITDPEFLAGLVPCICQRWSDSDVGCATCNGRGLMACNSCGGGGTAVPITAKLISRRCSAALTSWPHNAPCTMPASVLNFRCKTPFPCKNITAL